MHQKNYSLERLTEIVDLLLKGDKLTLLINYECTPQQAITNILEDYNSLYEECNCLRDDVGDLQNTISRLEHEAEQGHCQWKNDIEDLESQVYRLERENRNYKYRER
jgi:polyhydroxyalkanoate synthesis regulator phasin